VWVAIKPHRPIEPDMEICESKLFKQDGDFYLHIVVQKEVDVPNPELTGKTVIIACDVGEANPIAAVELWNYGAERRNVKFLGREVRGIRTLYSRIRKVIGVNYPQLKQGASSLYSSLGFLRGTASNPKPLFRNGNGRLRASTGPPASQHIAEKPVPSPHLFQISPFKYFSQFIPTLLHGVFLRGQDNSVWRPEECEEAKSQMEGEMQKDQP